MPKGCGSATRRTTHSWLPVSNQKASGALGAEQSAYQGQGAALLAFGSSEMDRRRDDDRRTDRYDRRRDERSIDRLRARGYDRPGRGAGGTRNRGGRRSAARR